MRTDADIQEAFKRGWRRGAFWALGFIALSWVAGKVGDAIVDANSNVGLALAAGGAILFAGSFVLWKTLGLPNQDRDQAGSERQG